MIPTPSNTLPISPCTRLVSDFRNSCSSWSFEISFSSSSTELEVNFERRRLIANGVDIHLTPTEWDLVKLFTTHPDKLLTDRMIMESVWGADVYNILYGSQEAFVIATACHRKRMHLSQTNYLFEVVG